LIGTITGVFISQRSGSTLPPNLKPYISNEYRKGDIRHCYADTQRARKLLNFEPTISLEDGLTELAGWAKTHDWGAVDLFEKALKELREKHLAA